MAPVLLGDAWQRRKRPPPSQRQRHTEARTVRLMLRRLELGRRHVTAGAVETRLAHDQATRAMVASST